MPGLNVAFSSAASAMSAIQRAINAVQNNVVNANTPGYAAENVSFSAQAFDPAQGLLGGVDVSLSSSRDQYLEQSVRSETSALGLQEQLSPMLASLQSAFSASGDSGVPGALSRFASSFSALSESPTDPSARSNAIQAASTVAQAFNQTATQISQVESNAAQQVISTVAQINTLTTHIASLNAEIQKGAQNDAGVAADLNTSLDSLSQLVNVSVTNNSDGSASVLLDGQTPLVLGSTAFALVAKQNPAAGGGIIVTDQNNEISAQATQGHLGAALQIVNQTVPYYLGNSTQPGVLNSLAESFANQVNRIVNEAQSNAGATIAPLFNVTNGTTAAATLAVGVITPDQIVTNYQGSSNGVATALANITTQAGLIENQSFTGYYGMVAGRAGTDASQAATDLTTRQDLTTQAQNQRTQASGVSLDAQAAQLLSLQQAYQATAKIVTILETLSQTVVNLIQA
jgi:flagellar hook-associated protein 1 FlgK